MATKQKKQLKPSKPQQKKAAVKKPSPKPAPKAAKAKPPAKKPVAKKPAKKLPVKKAAPPPPSKPAKIKAETVKPKPPTTEVSTTLSSAPPSNVLSKSTPTLFGGSPTDGGTRYLTVQDLVDLHKAVSVEFGGNQGHPGVVESQFGLVQAVQRPQVTTLGREAYPTFPEKVAAFLFALLQNRPFRGGNRRVALASLFAFCEINNRAVDSRVLDEKSAENLLRRASTFRELGVPPENVFREMRETMSRAIVAAG